MIAKAPKIDRRSFIVGTAAVGGGLVLGLNLPFGPFGGGVVRAQDGSPEITAWVVIRPDDTVVIRVARSEMGQGTLTGLAQMVAAASASRTNTCARAAPPRGRCWSRPQPTPGRCPPPSAAPPTA